jgi:6-pyruvoyltetrahydropterin/6-carboxytetrahydropterin synthase
LENERKVFNVTNPKDSRNYSIRVTKEDRFVFSAAHFITLPGHRCENLHGHNYRVALTLKCHILDQEAHFVRDFGEIKRLVQELLKQELDHRVLLAGENRFIRLSEHGKHTSALYQKNEREEGEHYLFPTHAVRVLPIQNTTAELLAGWILGELKRALIRSGAGNLTEIEVEVEEAPGQSAACREAFEAGGHADVDHAL